jgi:hypothetical protein
MGVSLNFPSGIGEAQAAINAYLAIGDGASPENYWVIANVGDESGPMMSADVVDVTSHSAPNPWSRKIVTLLNNGDLSFPLFFIPYSNGPGGHDNAGGLLAQLTSRALCSFVLQFPNPENTQWFFVGYVSKFNMKAPVKGVLTADVTLTLTNEPTLA